MTVPTIKSLVTKSDEELMGLLGYQEKVVEFKKNLKEADSLSGKPREKVEAAVARMFTPNIYPDDLKYTIESAKRAGKSGKEALCDCAPSSVLD